MYPDGVTCLLNRIRCIIHSLYSLLRRQVAVVLAACFLVVVFYVGYIMTEYGPPIGWAHSGANYLLPPGPARLPPPVENRAVTGKFLPNQTITEVLLEQGLSRTLANQIVASARPVYDLAKVLAGQPYWLYFTPEGDFRDFRYPVDSERYLTVYHHVGKDCLIPVMKEFPFKMRIESLSAVIQSSLYATILEIGEKDPLAVELADIFGSDIDFYTDIQKGDSFRVLIEKKYLDGRFIKYGTVLAASFMNRQKVITGFRFEDENGKPGYYSADGKSLKKAFLKSPLKFGYRITSRFSYARRHPILKTVRPHLGVDYAAPIGTPVQAVASGIVTFAGAKGANGRMVQIRHSKGYETMYLHLSKIAVKSGARVGQGDLIGRVGSTGLSTGPHLDFRIRRYGKALNPTKVVFPPGPPVPAERFEQFAAVRDELMFQLEQIDPPEQMMADGGQRSGRSVEIGRP